MTDPLPVRPVVDEAAVHAAAQRMADEIVPKVRAIINEESRMRIEWLAERKRLFALIRDNPPEADTPIIVGCRPGKACG